MKKTILLINLTFFVLACSTSKNKTNSQVNSGSKKKEITFNQDYIDKSVRPQDDFFKYANGIWVQNNPVPASESRWGSFNELDQANKLKISKILEELKDGVYDKNSIENLLGAYFSSFIDIKKRDELGISPIKKDLAKIQAITSYADYAGIIAEQHKYGISSIFGLGVGQDLKKVNENITYIGQANLGLPNKEYYIDENKKDILEKYQTHIENTFILAGYEAKIAKKAARNCVVFEIQLAEKMMSPAELRIPEDSYNLFSKKETESMLKNLDFDKYLSSVGSQSFENIVVGQPAYLKHLNKMVKDVQIEIWKDYLTWNTLNFYAGHLDSKFEAEDFAFNETILSGKSKMKPINERAINEITEMSIGEALGNMFVKKYFSEKSQQRVNVMVDNLLLTFNERIKNLTWMTDSTKLEALNKLNSIGRKLGFPSKWEDFSDLQLTKDSYVENIKKCFARDVSKNFKELYLPIDKQKWGMPAHMINAYYHPLLNEIVFPAGIMQSPFFEENGEDAINYGRIGMVIGHEFTHGFDDMGSKFAADGSFTNWWSEEDRKLFEEKTKVLGETFSGFCPIEGHCVNSELTMGENIADLGGITLAYYAYTKTDEFKSGELKNGFTPAQRFFISFAQLWKINYTDAEMKKRIANDEHSPGMYRVNGPLMNCPEFHEAFEVKEGDKMRNSLLKVAKIW